MKLVEKWMLLELLYVMTKVSCNIESIIDCGIDGHCKDNVSENMFEPIAESMSRCYCDDACIEYSDCCADIALSSNTSNEIVWSCVALSFNQSVYAVSNCIRDNEWKQFCEKEYYPPKFGHLVDIPFYSNITGRYYTNIFCARCDPQIEHAAMFNLTNYIIPSELTTLCSANVTEEMLQNDGVYQNGTLTWKVGEGFCVYYPEEDVYGRRCVPAVSSCPSGSDRDIAAKCIAYSLLISVQNKVYRNPHCAVCNGEKESDLLCTSSYQNPRQPFPGLQVLFHFDRDFEFCTTSEGVVIKNQVDWNCTAVTCGTTGCTVKSCNNNPLCSPRYRKSESYLTYTCLSLSIICLLVHVYKSIFVTPPDNLPAKYLNSLVWSLLIAQTFLLCGTYPLVPMPVGACYIVALIIEYFFLASFFWMNVISVDIWNTFSNAFKLISTSYVRYALYAWGGAAFITFTSVLGDRCNFLPKRFRPYYGTQNNCWFGNSVGLAVFFGGPVLLILILNCILFIMTLSLLRKQRSSTENSLTTGKKQYNTLLVFIKLSTIMGLAWIFGFILNSFNKWYQKGYPFIILNGLQGAFIFIIFDLKNEKFVFFMKRYLFTFFGGKKIKIKEIQEI